MLRLIDANMDRIREGLRVLEDIARFILNDASLSESLKKMRHNITEKNNQIQMQLLLSREAESDVGAFLKINNGTKREDLLDVTIANARRVEEALRVVEEFAKLPDIDLNYESFQKARFSVYQIEQDMVARLSRQNIREKITGLCVIIDLDVWYNRNLIEMVEGIIRSGTGVIRLKAKELPLQEILDASQKIKLICNSGDVLLIITNYTDIAILSNADGIHLEHDDLSLPDIRHILPQDKIIGYSITNVNQVRKAERDGADYLSIGPIYDALSEKKKTPGLRKLGQITQKSNLPVIATGGIDTGNIINVVKEGARCCEIDISVIEPGNIENSICELVASLTSISNN